jgi:DNA-binding MarR family transcriptional regulator
MAAAAARRPGRPPAGATRDRDAADYGVVIALREVTLQLNGLGAEFAARHGLHVTDLRAIIELLDAQRADLTATPTWLGQQLRLNSASVTALVDRLERTGMVSRHRESADRRRISLAVTGRAKQLGEAFFGPLIDQVMGIMDGFDAREREAIMRFLTGIGAAVGS